MNAHSEPETNRSAAMRWLAFAYSLLSNIPARAVHGFEFRSPKQKRAVASHTHDSPNVKDATGRFVACRHADRPARWGQFDLGRSKISIHLEASKRPDRVGRRDVYPTGVRCFGKNVMFLRQQVYITPNECPVSDTIIAFSCRMFENSHSNAGKHRDASVSF